MKKPPKTKHPERNLKFCWHNLWLAVAHVGLLLSIKPEAFQAFQMLFQSHRPCWHVISLQKQIYSWKAEIGWRDGLGRRVREDRGCDLVFGWVLFPEAADLYKVSYQSSQAEVLICRHIKVVEGTYISEDLKERILTSAATRSVLSSLKFIYFFQSTPKRPI